MSRAFEDATTRTFVLLAGVVAAVVGTTLPMLFTTAPDASSTGVGLLALALASLLSLGTHCVVSLGVCAQPVRTNAGDGPPPLLAGRVTDPVHHPLRPRAPGLV